MQQYSYSGIRAKSVLLSSVPELVEAGCLDVGPARYREDGFYPARTDLSTLAHEDVSRIDLHYPRAQTVQKLFHDLD